MSSSCLVRLCACLASLLINVVAQSTTQCGTVGHDLQTQQTRLTDLRFYLNTQNPAPCSGNVTTWQYCYYRPDVTATGEYQVAFGVYRSERSGYTRVSDDFLIDIPSNNIGSAEFICRTFTTPVVAIQEGDVIGACVHDVIRGFLGRTRAHINLAGNASGYSVLSADTSNERCNMDLQVSTPGSIPSSALTTANSTILHLYATIESTTATTQEPTIVVSTTDATTSTRAITQTTTDEPTTVVPSSEPITIAPSTEPVTTQTETTTMLLSTEPATTTSSTIMGGDTSSEGPMTDSTSSTTSQVTTNEIGDTGDFDTGTIIGVLVALLVISLLVIIVAVLVLVMAKRRRKQGYSVQNDANNPNSLDNVMYGKFNDKAQLEASAYEVPVSPVAVAPKNQNGFAEASTSSMNHTYDYTSFGPNQEVDSAASPPVYESPLDAPGISYSALIKKNQQVDIYAELEPYCPPSTQEDAIYGMIKSYGIINIPRTAIRSTGFLGSGHFANVEEGTWKKGVNKEVRVALKTMKEGASRDDKIKFLQEAAIMAQFRHPNVVSLYGVVSKGDPIVLVTELVHKGDLRHYLNSIRPDPGELPSADLPRLLLSFSQQVALGMQYLSGKGFVHRDLAARNILVSEEKICKVSDFGMSRNLLDETYYVAQGGKIPVKWTAPEALNYKKYSTASDVWSYGCLLYEIWSLGCKPFEKISNVEVISLVESGRRLPPPPGCPQTIYRLMILCWNPDKTSRPSFRDLVLTLISNEKVVLSVPQHAIQTHQLAGVIGAPLEAGERMYEDLQNVYANQDGLSDRITEQDNDYEEFD